MQMHVKSIKNFLSSMKFAIILLLVLIAACAAGSFVTQGQPFTFYAEQYGERAAGALVALQLDDVFHAWWFIVITAFLCLNLLLCNLTRLPGLLKRMRNSKTPREKAGLWGAWVCHLGILIVILGFGLGQMTKREYSVYGVPGDSKAIGDTSLILTIDDFRIDEREDGSVAQYTSDLTVRNAAEGTEGSASVSVNNPVTIYGMKFYQNSTGWAAEVHISKDGKEIQSDTLCVGDFLAVADKPDLVIYLNRFYPDYALAEGVGPYTASEEINNPAYLYSVYYQNQILGMNALMQDEELTIDEYTVTFSDPQQFTLIQIKRDPFTPLALLGGLVTLVGLVLAFYVKPQKDRMISSNENADRDPKGEKNPNGCDRANNENGTPGKPGESLSDEGEEGELR